MALTKISRGLLDTGVSDSSDATAITITSDENVGIGGTPVATFSGYDGASLHIQQSGTGSSVGSQVRLSSGSSGHAAGDGSYMAHWGDSNLYIANQENANILFYTNGSERLRITSGGEVGIGTTPTSGRNLHIYSTTQDALKVQVTTAVNQIELANSTNSPTYLTQDSYGFQIKADENGWGGSNSFFAVKVKASERFRIDSNGYFYYKNAPGSTASNPTLKINTSTGYLYYDSSSLRYKENVQNLPSALTNVNALRPVTFDEISSGESCFGLIAEEVNEVIPELVHLRNVDGFDTPQPDSVSYDKLSVFLLKAIQEQQTIIDDLKTRIETLENA